MQEGRRPIVPSLDADRMSMTEASEETDSPVAGTSPASTDQSPTGMSPYATGAGGVTFERKVAVGYLARLLAGGTAIELGHGGRVVGVSFQQAPAFSVDDLVVTAARGDEPKASLTFALAVRRSPNIVSSDELTQKLIRDFVHTMTNAPANGAECQLGLIVAGPKRHAEQLAQLAGLAAVQMDAAGFFDLVRTPNNLRADVRHRLDQVEKLVKRALVDLGGLEPGTAVVRRRTWQLLSNLTVLMPRLETPDETDWSAVTNALIPVARDADLSGASLLRDRLVALAGEYAPKAARIDLSLLRRDTHDLLDTTNRRHKQGWQALDHLHDRALGSVRGEITSGDGPRHVRLDRSDIAAELLETTRGAEAVVVSGESGVGKSALALLSLTDAATADPDAMQALCINLRHVPSLTVEFQTILGCPLADFLSELSAPQRMLVVDAAESVNEGMTDAFRYLADAARDSDVKVVAVTTYDSEPTVREILIERFGAAVRDHVVEPLTDAEIDEVVDTFTELADLTADTRSRELLRRLVVVDLLVRGGVSGVPLTDADAMNEVWSGLVRRHEAADRGSPDKRELALLRLADIELADDNRLDSLSTIDHAALDGLRRDGLLRSSVSAPFKIGPEFGHEEVRRYAVARLLLTDSDPALRLSQTGAPRWALGAARLACQEFLALPHSAARPLRGRFAALQASFDALVDEGYSPRWGDVPSEALLRLSNPDPVLRDAWRELQGGDNGGLKRIARLVDQRLRNDDGIVNPLHVEPIITLLLENDTPWRSGKYAQDLLRDWLRGHVLEDTPAGQPLRTTLRERLVGACTAADLRLAKRKKTEAARRTKRRADKNEGLPQLMEHSQALFTEIGVGGRRRRKRPEIPPEITTGIVLELLALLGPDLGDEGEEILLRVARDAPWQLDPVVEDPLAARAITKHRQGLLAHLTEAYYLDDEADGSGFNDEGIRDHRRQTISEIFTHSAWYRGPFMTLFQTDFRNGVAVLNRLLNHAARVRVGILTRIDQTGSPIDPDALGSYEPTLEITGERRVYVGDVHVWIWYRGTGVGPEPCLSALQALERVCDQLINLGTPISALVSTLLRGCENLAMVGLVVALLVRHLEQAGRLLDPYFTEPLIWRHEFTRVTNEMSSIAASSKGLVAPERRSWSLREAAMAAGLRSDEKRTTELRRAGQTLVANARREIESAFEDAETDVEADVGKLVEHELAVVRVWATSLDPTTYKVHMAPDRLYVQAIAPESVVEALQPGSADLERAQQELQLQHRYHIELQSDDPQPVRTEQLATDLGTARKLLHDPSPASAFDPWDTPALIAATALEAHLLRNTEVRSDDLVFAADTVLQIGEREASPRPYEFEETYFEQGADRSAARSLPLLVLPVASELRAMIETKDGDFAVDRVTVAGLNLARAVPNEVRLHLARGLDPVWNSPCTDDGPCFHEVGLTLATETMRDCALGDWIPNTGRRRTLVLEEPVGGALADTADDSIISSRLDAAIRALAPTATANICISTRARDLLTTLLAAQQRSLLGAEQWADRRSTSTLVSARALLTLEELGDGNLSTYIEAYADNADLLGKLLRALSAAAEEAPQRAATARRIWPSVIRHVLNLHDTGHTLFQDPHLGDMTLAALIPNPASDGAYLYREVQDKPIVWWEPLAWQPEVESWLAAAKGHASCVYQLINFLEVLARQDQAAAGLPWVAKLTLADPARIARRTNLLPSWLVEIRSAAATAGLSSTWQEVVDVLVVNGETRLAPYAE